MIGLQQLQNINIQVTEWNGQNNGLIMLLDDMDIIIVLPIL